MPTVTAITFHFVLINRQTPVFPIDHILTSGIIAFTALVLFVALSAVGLGHISWTANELFSDAPWCFGDWIFSYR